MSSEVSDELLTAVEDSIKEIEKLTEKDNIKKEEKKDTINNEELWNLQPKFEEIDYVLSWWSVEDLEQKKSSTQNIIQQQRVNHENAYNKRSKEDDNSLSKFYREWKSIPELMKIFSRNRWGIVSRLKKLWLLGI